MPLPFEMSGSEDSSVRAMRLTNAARGRAPQCAVYLLRLTSLIEKLRFIVGEFVVAIGRKDFRLLLALFDRADTEFRRWPDVNSRFVPCIQIPSFVHVYFTSLGPLSNA